MSLYAEKEKPNKKRCGIEEWRAKARALRGPQMDSRVGECFSLRNSSRQLRYEADIQKAWELYYNNVKLGDRIYQIEVLIGFAETMLPVIGFEKKRLAEEKYLTERLLQKCDDWLQVCVVGLNTLDGKLDCEITYDDDVMKETKQEVKFLDAAKIQLKGLCMEAWQQAGKLEEMEARIELNLEFKKEVLDIDKRCVAINKMDTGVSFKVDPDRGPDKMLSMEEWYKEVYGLVERSQGDIRLSLELRDRMVAGRDRTLNEYRQQIERTDFAFRKRIYEINREKNEVQYQLRLVTELMRKTEGEWTRLDQLLKEAVDDLRCVETRAAERYFRPTVDATVDPPFTGINREAAALREKIDAMKHKSQDLKGFYNKMESDAHVLNQELTAKNKGMQVQIQALDMRLAVRDDSENYGYDREIVASSMAKQLPPRPK